MICPILSVPNPYRDAGRGRTVRDTRNRSPTRGTTRAFELNFFIFRTGGTAPSLGMGKERRVVDHAPL